MINKEELRAEIKEVLIEIEQEKKKQDEFEIELNNSVDKAIQDTVYNKFSGYMGNSALINHLSNFHKVLLENDEIAIIISNCDPYDIFEFYELINTLANKKNLETAISNIHINKQEYLRKLGYYIRGLEKIIKK